MKVHQIQLHKRGLNKPDTNRLTEEIAQTRRKGRVALQLRLDRPMCPKAAHLLLLRYSVNHVLNNSNSNQPQDWHIYPIVLHAPTSDPSSAVG